MTICDNNEIIFSSIVRKLKTIPSIDILDVSHMSKKKIKSGTEEIEINYYYTEITNQNVDKWYAIEKLAQIEEIPKEDIMTIGDNMNDLLMIKNAGLGVAMKNSNPIVKNNADFITEDNNENGVAVAINNMLQK